MMRRMHLRRINPVPMFAGVVSAVLVLGTLIGQGGHAKGDADGDMTGMAAYMPGMSMPGMNMGNGAGGSGSTDSSMANMPGMPMEAATPNTDAGAGGSTVALKPGKSGTAGGMSVRLVKVSHGAATVQMSHETATLRQGAQKKFGDGMTVKAVKVQRDGATLKVTPPQ
jgi:hypothetical protein